MKSMTAYASLQQTFDWGSVQWDIRSVNHRYLDLQFRLPEWLKTLEHTVRDACKAKVSRGKLEISLKIHIERLTTAWEIDTDELDRLQQAIRSIQSAFPQATALNPVEILMLPGVQKTTETGSLSVDRLRAPIMDTLDQAFIEFNASRTREGNALKKGLEEKLQALDQEVAEVHAVFPSLFAHHSENLTRRLTQMESSLDETRLAQEIVYLAQKSDIQEELDRLNTHIIEVHRVLQNEEIMGRRLDFLMQELNREANTLGSKSIHSKLSQSSVEMKVLIEQMREQIQNIE